MNTTLLVLDVLVCLAVVYHVVDTARLRSQMRKMLELQAHLLGIDGTTGETVGEGPYRTPGELPAALGEPAPRPVDETLALLHQGIRTANKLLADKAVLPHAYDNTVDKLMTQIREHNQALLAAASAKDR